LLSTWDSELPSGFAYQLGLPLARDSQLLGEPVLAIGPIASVGTDWTDVRVASTDIFLLPSAIITTTDGKPVAREALQVGDLVAVGGDALGGEAGIGRRVVVIDAPFVPGATLTYKRFFAGNEGDIASPLVPSAESAGWVEALCVTDSANGPCTPVVAAALATEGKSLGDNKATKVRSSIRAKDISGSGIRAKGISGSGIRAKGISGSGIRAKGISGSGIRAKGISGSGIRAKGISGSGIRAKAANDLRAD
jgi:hypothetical protein